MHPDTTTTGPADAVRAVVDAHAHTLAAGTARYTWRTPVDGRVETSAHGHTDLTTGAATMTSATTAPPSSPPPTGDGVLVLDGLIALPGQEAPGEVEAHALLVPQAGTLSMVLLSGPPTLDAGGRWTGPRSSAPALAMEVDPLLGSVAGTFHWLAAVTSAESGETPGRYRVGFDLSRLVEDAGRERREGVRLTLDQLQPGLSAGSASGTVEIDPASGFVTSVGVTGAGPGDGIRIDPVLLELREHGAPVRIEVPPAHG
ncbi:hypothetical protein GTQ99_08660 [Kineococcus sp. T13]|uniref:hypothetical protein n=1 Tax=Kineococcus vitellinus TaxID=2696565 RepID=UPI001411C555|nr:hypothetical protein [Kineococcus vitellinus]NAZ75491.1 hypothetical protein [Kineococcus vitellinus]